jgi:hypothetical protein
MAHLIEQSKKRPTSEPTPISWIFEAGRPVTDEEGVLLAPIFHSILKASILISHHKYSSLATILRKSDVII